MRFGDLFKESKQVGIIYHFTTLHGLKLLSDKNRMAQFGCEIFTFVSENDHLSTTRGYFLTDTPKPFSTINSKSHPIRIAFDGDRISEKFKVRPINGREDSNSDIFGVDKNYLRVPHKSEQEEVICPDKTKMFKMKDFILEIQIKNFDHQETLKLKQEIDKIIESEGLNIFVNIVRKWKPFGRSEKEVNESIGFSKVHYEINH